MRMQHEQLALLSDQNLAGCVDKIPNGYPPAADKLRLMPGQWSEIAQNGYVMPQGKWTLDHHRRQQDGGAEGLHPIYTAENPAPQQEIQRWQRLGLRIDQESGLPIHPRAEQLLTTVGMFTQVGSFYAPGPNPVVNVGVRRVRNHVAEYACVAVRRSRPRTDTMSGDSIYWSLAGGFVNQGKDEDRLVGALRETREELGLRVGEIGNLALHHYDDEPQYTWAATVHAWMQESYYFASSLTNVALEGFEKLTPEDRKEIVDTAWLTREQMNDPALDFMDTHRAMIDKHDLFLRSSALSGI